MNAAQAAKAKDQVEARIARMEEIEDPTPKQEEIMGILEDLLNVLEELISASEG